MSGKTCQETIDLLLDYLEGRLSAEEKSAVEEHLAACPPCVEFVNSYRSTPEILRKALPPAMPPEVADRLKSFLRDRRYKS